MVNSVRANRKFRNEVAFDLGEGRLVTGLSFQGLKTTLPRS